MALQGTCLPCSDAVRPLLRTGALQRCDCATDIEDRWLCTYCRLSLSYETYREMLRALPSDPQLPVNDPMRPVGDVRRWVDHLAGNHRSGWRNHCACGRDWNAILATYPMHSSGVGRDLTNMLMRCLYCDKEVAVDARDYLGGR